MMQDSLLLSTMPSHSAVIDVFRCPTSMTNAVALPLAYLHSSANQTSPVKQQ